VGFIVTLVVSSLKCWDVFLDISQPFPASTMIFHVERSPFDGLQESPSSSFRHLRRLFFFSSSSFLFANLRYILRFQFVSTLFLVFPFLFFHWDVYVITISCIHCRLPSCVCVCVCVCVCMRVLCLCLFFTVSLNY